MFARQLVTIGNHVRVLPGVIINTGRLELDGNQLPYKYYEQSVVIEDGGWTASGAHMLPEVKIGLYSVVASGAVINKDVPCYTVVGGVPARIIRHVLQLELIKFEESRSTIT